MGLEAVKEEILNSAKEQSNHVIAEARKESGRIMKETESKIREMEANSEAETKKILEAIKRQELASAELESKKMALEAKKQAIEAVFAEARKRLEGMDDKKRELYIKKLLEKVKGDMEMMYAYCSRRDLKFLRGFNAEPASITGGLIAENKEKTIRIDYSFDTLLEMIKDNELQNISKMLFG